MDTSDKDTIASEISGALPDFLVSEGLAPEEILQAAAQTIVERFRNQNDEGFELIFSRVEQHIIWSSPDLRQWVIVSFLEILKNVSAWSDLDYQVFEKWLGPESYVAWRWLEKRWQGSHSLADTLKYGSKKKPN